MSNSPATWRPAHPTRISRSCWSTRGKVCSTQTHRHSIIVSLLGVRHVVLAVNKIDLVDYSESVFRRDRSGLSEIRRTRSAFARWSRCRSPPATATMSRRRARARPGMRARICSNIWRASKSKRIAGARPSACRCNGSTGRTRIFAASPERSRADASREAIASSPPIPAVKAPSPVFSSPTVRSKPPRRATPSR